MNVCYDKHLQLVDLLTSDLLISVSPSLFVSSSFSLSLCLSLSVIYMTGYIALENSY